MALITDAALTLKRITQLRMAADGAEEARTLDSLRGEFAELAGPIHELADKAAVFRDEGVNLSAIPDLSNVRESVEKAFERFQLTPKAATLRQGRVWTALTNKLETLAQKAQTVQTADWQHYFDDHMFGGLPPAKREVTLAKTPQNEQALLRYRELYKTFIRYRLQPATNADEFNKLHSLSQQLAEITFQEDVPDAVRTFLDALSGGAGLHLLTPDVLTWLRDNDLLANYVVRARIN